MRRGDAGLLMAMVRAMTSDQGRMRPHKPDGTRRPKREPGPINTSREQERRRRQMERADIGARGEGVVLRCESRGKVA